MRILITLSLILFSQYSHAQMIYAAKYILAKDSFKLKTVIDSISTDTLMAGASHRKLATSLAVKTYIDNLPSGTTDLSFSGATSPVTLNSSTGTDVYFKEGTNVTLTQSGDTLTITSSGGSGSPGGSNTQIQFNDSGVFGGDADFTWDKTNNGLTLGSTSVKGYINFADTSTTNSYIYVKNLPFLTMFDGTTVQNYSRHNLYLGIQAGNANNTGLYNTGVGMYTQKDNTSGSRTISIGNSSLLLMQSGIGIVALGYSAIPKCKNCPNSIIGIGDGAMPLLDSTRATDNIGIGSNVLPYTVYGRNNIAIGYSAGPATDLDNTITFGRDCRPIASGQCVIGSSIGNGPTITQIWMGSPSGSPQASYIAGPYQWRRIGIQAGATDMSINPLAAFEMIGANGTGTGNGGDVTLGVFLPGASGSAQNTTITRALRVMGSSGHVQISTNTSSGALTDMGGLLQVKGKGSTSSTYTAIYTNSSGSTSTATLAIRDDGKVSIGTNSPATSSVLDVSSTTAGFLPPRMTTAERDLISSPAAGLIIFNTTTSKHQGYDGSTWNDFY